MIIKIFLIGSVLAVALFLIRGGASGRHLAVRRLATALFASGWVVAVIAPDTVTQVANFMGVGRGTDLVLYVLVVAFVFATVAQQQHMRELDDRIARLTRELALTGASHPAAQRPPVGVIDEADQVPSTTTNYTR